MVYDKTCDAHRYEDRGIKHLYESHHSCRGAKDGKYCNLFCAPRLSSTNFKQDNMYQVENEEMVCTDADVNYGQLDSFSHDRNETDVPSKVLLFSTLIPPPATMLNNEVCCVFVTEINADLSCDFISSCTIQDPKYINYDEDTVQVHLDNPWMITEDKDMSHMKF